MCALVTGVQTCALPISWRDGGVREARFCLGAADGFTPEERAGADKVIAFGRATWPHLMARAMLAEQLWRATSRSEERRVGKECGSKWRSRGGRLHSKKKNTILNQ